MRYAGTRWRTTVLAVALLGAGGVTVAAAAAAQAAEPAGTVCVAGQTVSGDVAGDLYVPPGVTCWVTKAHVQGRVSVGPQAQLYLDSSRIDLGLTVGTLAGATATGSEIDGTVHLDYAQFLFVTSNSTLVGDVQGILTGQAFEFENAASFYLAHSAIHGNVSIRLEATYRSGSTSGTPPSSVTCAVNGADMDFTDSRITGQAVLDDALTDNELNERIGTPSQLCAVTVGGNLTLRGSPGKVLLGGGLECPGVQPISVHGSLLILDNTGTVHVSAHIGGDLVCRRNTHHPIAGHPTSEHLHTTVGGHALGQ